MSVTKTSRKKQMSIATCAQVQFIRAVKAGKLIRTAFSRLLFNIGDPHLTARLTAALLKVVQTDAVHDHGLRTAGSGNLSLLNGFEFNKRKLLSKHFFADFQAAVNRETGCCTVMLPRFVPGDRLKMPHANCYFRLIIAAGAFDFEGELYHADIQTSDYLSTRKEAALLLQAQLPVNNQLHTVVLLGIQYYRKVNDQYLLSYRGGPMALQVIHTDRLLPLPMKD